MEFWKTALRMQCTHDWMYSWCSRAKYSWFCEGRHADGFQHGFLLKRIGQLNLCTLHFFLSQFAYAGCAELCEQLPQDGMECQEGLYRRPVKGFWLRFTAPPTVKEVPAESEARKKLMSPYAVSQASTYKPFLLSINALMIFIAFCNVFTRFCPEKPVFESGWCHGSRHSALEIGDLKAQSAILRLSSG